MAEVFKGLTIQIGADTSELQNSLKSVQASLRTTQTELNSINKLLKLDPDNVVLLKEKMQLLGDKCGELGLKLDALREQEKKLDTETSDFRAEMKSLGLAVSESDADISTMRSTSLNLSVALQTAKDAVTAAEEKLAKLHTELKESALQTREFNTYLKESGKSIESYDSHNTELVEDLRKLGLVTDEVVAENKELVTSFKTLSERMDQIKSLKAFEDTKIDIEETKVKLNECAKEAVEVSTKFNMIKDDAKLINTAIDALETEFKELSSAYKIDKNFENLNSTIRTSTELIAAMESKLEGLESELKQINASGNTKLNSSMIELAEATETAKTKMTKLEEELSLVRAELSKVEAVGEDTVKSVNFDTTTASAKELKEQIKLLEAEYREAEAELKEATDATKARELATTMSTLKAKVKEVATESKSMGNGLEAAFNGMRRVGYALYATIFPALLQVMYKVVSVTEDIDSAYRDMRKTVDATESEYEELYEAALEYSTVHMTSADELLEIEALLGQVGIGYEHLAEVAEVVANLDIATDLDAEELATQFGQLFTTMQMSQEDADNFGDALVRLGNNMATTESQIMSVTARIGSTSTIYGFSADEVLGWSAAISSTGQKAEAAGTAFVNVMEKIQIAVSGGGSTLEEFARVAGVSSSEFAQMWSTDPSGTLYTVINGLRSLSDSGESLSVIYSNLGISAVRQKQLLSGLVQEFYNTADGSETLANALSMAESAWNNGGDAAEEAAKKTEGFSGKLALISNNVDVLCTVLGDAAVPILNTFAGLVQWATELVTNMGSSTLTAVEWVAGGLTALGPVLVATSAVGSTFHGIFTKISNVMSNFVAWVAKGAETGAFFRTKLNSLLGVGQSLFSTFGGVGVATLGLIAAEILVTAKNCVTAYTEAQKYKNVISDLSKTISSYSGNATFTLSVDYLNWDDIQSATRGVLDAVEDLTNAYKENMDTAASTAAEAEYYLGIMNSLTGMDATDAENAAKLELALSGINEALGTNYDLVIDNSGAWEIMDGEAEVALSDIQTYIDNFIQNAKVEALGEIVQGIVRELAELEVQTNDTQKSFDAIHGEGAYAYAAALMQIEAENDRVIESMEAAGFRMKNYGDMVGTVTDDTRLEIIAIREQVETTQELEGELDNATEVYAAESAAIAQVTDETEGATDAQQDLEDEVLEVADVIESLAASDVVFADWFSQLAIDSEDLAQAFSNAGLSFDEFVSTYQENVNTYVTATQLLSDSFEEYNIDDLINNMISNTETRQTWLDNLDALGELVTNDTQQMFLDYMSEDMDAFYTVLPQFLNDPDKFNEAAEAYYNEVMVELDNVGDDYLEQLSITPTFDTDALDEEWEEVKTYISDAVDVLPEDLLDVTNAAGVDIASNIADGIIASQDDLSTTTSTVLTESITGMQAADSAVILACQTTGQYMMQGLANGISASAYIVSAAAEAAAQSALTAAKNKLGIASPSKEMYKIGAYFTEGFSEGISNTKYLSVENAADMARSAMMAVQASNAGLRAVSNQAVGNTYNNYYTIDGIDFTGDTEVEGAMTTLITKMQRLGRL